jgi:hypothetical protein
MKREGQVKAVTSRDFQSIKLWSFQLEGSDRYYRTGKTKPDIGEGQWVKFEERNGVVQLESLEVVDAPTGAAAPPATEPATSASEKSTTPRSDAPQSTAPSASVSEAPAPPAGAVGERIRYQAARRDASNIVIAALHCDHLPHASNVAKGKRLDLLLQYVAEVTQTLLEQEDAA